MNRPYNKYEILLGSKSPRRQQLISELKLNFRHVKIESDEDYPEGLKPEWVAPYLAEKKSKAYEGDIESGQILLTADTVVICGDEVLNKPGDATHAVEMLTKLSGASHKVVTGVCMRDKRKNEVFSNISIVEFNRLNTDDMAFYIENYQPFDKAGGYGIQDWIGLSHIKSIQGSYFNIVGLPTHLIIEKLENW